MDPKIVFLDPRDTNNVLTDPQQHKCTWLAVYSVPEVMDGCLIPPEKLGTGGTSQARLVPAWDRQPVPSCRGWDRGLGPGLGPWLGLGAAWYRRELGPVPRTEQYRTLPRPPPFAAQERRPQLGSGARGARGTRGAFGAGGARGAPTCDRRCGRSQQSANTVRTTRRRRHRSHWQTTR